MTFLLKAVRVQTRPARAWVVLTAPVPEEEALRSIRAFFPPLSVERHTHDHADQG
jgi:hypothetical protein